MLVNQTSILAKRFCTFGAQILACLKKNRIPYDDERNFLLFSIKLKMREENEMMKMEKLILFFLKRTFYESSRFHRKILIILLF